MEDTFFSNLIYYLFHFKSVVFYKYFRIYLMAQVLYFSLRVSLDQ